MADTIRAAEFMNESVRAVASIGAPYEPGHVEHNYDALLERILADGEAPFMVGGKALTLRRHFITDVRAADLRAQIRTLRRALLVMHSPTDNTVGIANASEIFRAARHPRSFVSLEGAAISSPVSTRPGGPPASSAPGPIPTSPTVDPAACRRRGPQSDLVVRRSEHAGLRQRENLFDVSIEGGGSVPPGSPCGGRGVLLSLRHR